MTVDVFFKRIDAQLAVNKKTHRLGKPASDEKLAKWLKKHPDFAPLPETFVQFLKRADGMLVLVDKYELSGASLRLLGLSKLAHASKVMHFENENESGFPEHYVGLGVDGNHDWSPVLDTQTGQVRICDHVGGVGDSAEVLDSFEDFLDWIAQRLLDPHELAEAAEQKKNAKGHGKGKPATMEAVHIFRKENVYFYCMAITPDGRWVVSGEGSNRESLLLWDLQMRGSPRDQTDGGKLFSSVPCNANWVNGPPRSSFGNDSIVDLAVLPDGRHIVCLASSTGVWMLETAKGKLVQRIDCGMYSDSLRLSPNAEFIAIGGDFHPHSLRVIASKDFRDIGPWRALSVRTLGLAFSADSQRVFLGGLDRSLCARETTSGNILAEFPRPPSNVMRIVASPDGKSLAVNCSGSRAVRILDAGTGELLMELSGHAQQARVFAFSPDSQRLAVFDAASVARVWDLQTQRVIAIYKPEDDLRYGSFWLGVAIAFHPDGRHLLTCSIDGTIRMLRLPEAASHPITAKAHG